MVERNFPESCQMPVTVSLVDSSNSYHMELIRRKIPKENMTFDQIILQLSCFWWFYVTRPSKCKGCFYYNITILFTITIILKVCQEGSFDTVLWLFCSLSIHTVPVSTNMLHTFLAKDNSYNDWCHIQQMVGPRYDCFNCNSNLSISTMSYDNLNDAIL